MPSPHIVMLNKAFPPWVGGIERHVYDISLALAARGWKVSVLVCNDGRFSTRERVFGVDVYRVPTWTNLFSQPIPSGYYQKLRELKPDLVHVHVPFPLGWGAAGEIEEGMPLVCTWHSDIIRQRFLRPVYHLWEQAFLRRCHRIVVTSDPLLRHSKPLRKHTQKAVVIPLSIPESGIAPPRTPPESVEAIRRVAPGPLVLFVGRLVGYKGLPYLLQAMKDVDATLLIAGDGPLRKPLETWVHRRQLSPRVRFLGAVDEGTKRSLYRAADVFVLPSIERNEAFGYVLLEAMAEGCPVITTDLPTGVGFVNQAGESGLVVPPRDSPALAESLNRILGNPDLRRTLAEGARTRAAREFRFADCMDRLEAVYRSGLGMDSASG